MTERVHDDIFGKALRPCLILRIHIVAVWSVGSEPAVVKDDAPIDLGIGRRRPRVESQLAVMEHEVDELAPRDTKFLIDRHAFPAGNILWIGAGLPGHTHGVRAHDLQSPEPCERALDSQDRPAQIASVKYRPFSRIAPHNDGLPGCPGQPAHIMPAICAAVHPDGIPRMDRHGGAQRHLKPPGMPTAPVAIPPGVRGDMKLVSPGDLEGDEDHSNEETRPAHRGTRLDSASR